MAHIGLAPVPAAAHSGLALGTRPAAEAGAEAECVTARTGLALDAAKVEGSKVGGGGGESEAAAGWIMRGSLACRAGGAPLLPERCLGLARADLTAARRTAIHRVSLHLSKAAAHTHRTLGGAHSPPQTGQSLQKLPAKRLGAGALGISWKVRAPHLRTQGTKSDAVGSLL